MIMTKDINIFFWWGGSGIFSLEFILPPPPGFQNTLNLDNEVFFLSLFTVFY